MSWCDQAGSRLGPLEGLLWGDFVQREESIFHASGNSDA